MPFVVDPDYSLETHFFTFGQMSRDRFANLVQCLVEIFFRLNGLADNFAHIDSGKAARGFDFFEDARRLGGACFN